MKGDIVEDYNEEALIYFTRVTNHSMLLVKAKSSLSSTAHHEMTYPIIVDSGANYHMFKGREFFNTILLSSGNDFLGDGKTVLTIKGTGTFKCNIGGNILTIKKCLLHS
jgi:hypothetical protein